MSRWYKTAGQLLASVWPALAYVICYDLARHLPNPLRPAINTEILVQWETLLFGGLPHRWLGAYAGPTLDVLAAIPYQFHFVVPLVFIAFLWRRHRALIATFAWCYALMNFAWMVTALFVLPTAPPWYFEMFGTRAGDYTMIGNAAALLRVDALLGIPLFENLYRQSSMVFAAFPSMHAAWPALIALFSWPLVRLRTSMLLWLYTAWVWWAAMYLQHHYAVDILGGAGYAIVTYAAVNANRCRNRIGATIVVNATTSTITP